MQNDKLLGEISIVKHQALLTYADRKRLEAGETVQLIEESLEQRRKALHRQAVYGSWPAFLIPFMLLVLVVMDADHTVTASFLPCLILLPLVMRQGTSNVIDESIMRDEILFTIWKSQKVESASEDSAQP